MASRDWCRFGQTPPEPWTAEQDTQAKPDDGAGGEEPMATLPGDDPDGVPEDDEPVFDEDPSRSPRPREYDAADSAAPTSGSVVAVLAHLTDELAAVRSELARLVTLNEQQAALVDRLHADNQTLRRVEAERQRDPIVRELIGLVDSNLRTARVWLDGEDVAAPSVAESLRGVSDDIRLILEHQGVESYVPSEGSPFDRREHRAKGTRATADATLKDRVAEALKPGYFLGERVIRAAEVLVWEADTAAAEPTPHEETPSGVEASHAPGTPSSEAEDGEAPSIEPPSPTEFRPLPSPEGTAGSSASVEGTA